MKEKESKITCTKQIQPAIMTIGTKIAEGESVSLGGQMSVADEVEVRQKIKDIIGDIFNNADKYEIELKEFSYFFFLHYKKGLINLSLSRYKKEEEIEALKLEIDSQEILLSEKEEEYISKELGKEAKERFEKYRIKSKQDQEDLLNSVKIEKDLVPSEQRNFDKDDNLYDSNCLLSRFKRFIIRILTKKK